MKAGRAKACVKRDRLSENELQTELQLSSLVGRAGDNAKTARIVDVVPRRAQDRRVEQVECLGAKLEATAVTPQRELPEDRRIDVPEALLLEPVGAHVAEGSKRRFGKRAGVEVAGPGLGLSTIGAGATIGITYQIGLFVSGPTGVPGIGLVFTVSNAIGLTGTDSEDAVDLPVANHVIHCVAAAGVAFARLPKGSS